MRRLACIGLVRCLCELTARRTNQALWAPANWPHGRESGTRLAEQQYTWPHYCRGTNRYADRGAPTTGTASEPILTKGSAGLPTLADPSGSQHGWPSREQDVPFRFGAAQYRPHGTPGRYPAKPHDPEKRISRPGAASDSGRIGHFVKVFSDHSQAVSKVLTEIDCQNLQTSVLSRGPVGPLDY